MSNNPQQDEHTPALLTTVEVAKKLRLSRQTVRSLCEQGEFEGAFKIGRQWRIPAVSLPATAA